jgi:NACHT domain
MTGKRLPLWPRAKWYGALLGSVIVFALARNLNAMVQWASILSFFATLVGLLLSMTPQSQGPTLGLAAQLDAAVEDLAAAVEQQWRAEERLRRLQDPFPLPVRWTAADALVTDHWGNIRMESSASGPLQIDGRLPDIVDVFNRVPSRRLVILGSPGAGKSSLVLRFTLDYIERRQPGDLVPAIFLLASWDPRCQNLHDWMASRLAADFPALGTKAPTGHSWARELVQAGRVLPVLDGFDEIPQSLRQEAMRSLNAAFDRASPVVLTCRADEYRDTVYAADVLTSAAVVELCPLRLDELSAYLPMTTRRGSHPFAVQLPTKWEPVLIALRANPDDPVVRNLLETLSNPLMTSLARTVYSDTGADPYVLLGRRFIDRRALEGHLLDAFIPAVYSMPETSSAATVAYRPDQSREWLTSLARHLDQLGTRDIAWWQLPTAVPRLTRGILAAVIATIVMTFVMTLAGGLRVGLTFGLAYGLACGFIQGAGRGQMPSYVEVRFRGTARRFLGRFAVGIATGVVVGVALGLPTFASLTVALAFGIVVPLHVWLDIPTDLTRVSSPAAVLRQNRIATLTFGLTIAVTFGLSAGFSFIFTVSGVGGPFFYPVAGMPFGLSIALCALVAGAVTGWLADGAVGSAAYGVASAIAVGFVYPPIRSVPFGLAVGAAFGLVTALLTMLPKAWGAFVFTRVWLAARGQLPWHLMTFLADAHRRGVLRQVGGIYQFRHAMLQDYLAGRSVCVTPVVISTTGGGGRHRVRQRASG